jgi:hypothetical protein
MKKVDGQPFICPDCKSIRIVWVQKALGRRYLECFDCKKNLGWEESIVFDDDDLDESGLFKIP